MTEASAQQESVSSGAVQSRSFESHVRRLLGIRELGPFVLLIGLLVFFALWDPNFASARNISNMTWFVPEIGLIALGMTLLLTAGEFDLSVGAMFAFAQNSLFVLMQKGIFDVTFSPYAAFGVAIVVALLNGLLIGLLVTKARISSFLVTLAMMLILRGTTLLLTQNFRINIDTTLEDTLLARVLANDFTIGEFRFFTSLGWWLGIAVILHFVLNQTAFGNWIMATGGDPDSASARGVNTDRVKISLFMLSSALAAFASIISAARLDTAVPRSGDGYELEVIAMSVIGGTLLLGGRGTIIGTVMGALLLRTLGNGINFVGIPGIAFPIFIGFIIIVMLLAHNALDKVARFGEK